MARGEGDGSGRRRAARVIRRQQVEPAGQVLQPVGDEMDDVGGALDAAPDHGEARAEHCLAVALQHTGPDHDVHDAGFVLQRHEDDPAGAAGALTDQHQAGGGRALPVPGAGDCLGRERAPLRQAGAQEGERVCPEREPERPIVLDDLLAGRHGGQGGQRLRALGRSSRRLEEGKRRRFGERARLPERLAPVEPHGAEGVGGGQRLDGGGSEPGPALHGGNIGPEAITRLEDALRVLLAEAGDLAQAEAERVAPVRPAFQAVVPAARMDIDRADFDPVLAGVPHDLGGGVEAHRLGVEQRAGENFGMVAFDPGGDISQKGEARGMGLRKAVIPEALDLAEAARREFRVVAARGHPAHHPVPEQAERAALAEGGHGVAQRIGLVRREPGRLHGDAHRLFLEERHAERLLQHLAQLVRGPVLRRRRRIDHLLQPVPPAQIGMHHVALDRAGAHDRHLDHQVVEGARLQARQHVHLRPALDLEDADGVGPADHVPDLPVFRRHGGEREVQALVRRQQFEGLADAGQHAEAQHIDLHQAERLQVVLVPLDEGAVLHRRIADGHGLVERAAGQHEAADMLGEVSGKALKFGCERNGPAEQRIGGVEPGLAQALLGHPLAAHVADGGGERGGGVLRQPHRLAHVAHGAAGAVGDDGGGDPGALAAVAPVDVLDHLLAPLMLEIDVDVGRLAALAGDEALEQEVDPGRIDGGDAEAVADRRVRRGAPPLAEDVLAVGVAHDVVDGEEIGGVVQLADQPELVPERGGDLLRDAVRIAPGRALPGERLQMPLRGAAGRHRLVGILVGEFVEAETAEAGDFEAPRDSLLVAAEESCDLGSVLEVALGIGDEAPARFRHGHMLADGCQHVLQRPAFGAVVVDVVGGQQRRAGALRQRGQAAEAGAVAAPVEHVRGEVERAVMRAAEAGEFRLEIFAPRLRRQRDQKLSLGIGKQVLPVQHASALGRAPLAESKQPAEAPVGGAVAGIAEQRGAAREVEPRAGQQADAGPLRRHMGANRAGERVAVGDADGRKPEPRGLLHQFLRMGGAAQEAEIADRLQFRVRDAAHPYSPWMYQRGGPLPPASR